MRDLSGIGTSNYSIMNRTNIIITLLLPLFLFCGVSSFCYGTNAVQIERPQPLSFSILNTNYTITTKVDLKGKTIKVASGCCLHFEGGSLANGTLIGNNTRVVASFGKIFSTTLKLEGSFNSDKIMMFWWSTSGSKYSTKEVQYALSSILKFSNRVFEFDMPVSITSVSFTLKWSPMIKFLGFSNSNQNDLAVTVLGKDSRGGVISGTENLRFENFLFRGDENNPPRTLLFASKYTENKHWPGHRFQDASFCGKVLVSQVYNYFGESWYFENCKFSIDKNGRCDAVCYARLSTRERFKVSLVLQKQILHL